MTEPVAFRRRFRGGDGTERIPKELAQWFAGEIADTWYAILPYETTLLPLRWNAWKLEHSEAKPPAGYEWLDNPSDPQHPSDEQIREARKMVARALPE